jgi:hypothetical protein
MTPSNFAAKWERITTTERASSQSHFLDLCELRETRDTKSPAYPLLLAHEKLDAAVAAAYGWQWPMTDDEILAALLALNLERAAA